MKCVWDQTTRGQLTRINWRNWVGSGPALVLLVLGVMLCSIVAAYADSSCEVGGNQVPQCQTVSSPAISLSGWQTKGWALYCPQSASYYWSGWDADRDGCSAISVIENPWVEGISKADFTMTNWCVTTHTVTLTIGCSPVNPSGSCTGGGGACPSDPGCPQANQMLRCVGEGEDQSCWPEWTETCINGTTVTNYFCTQALPFLTCCFTC